MNLQMDATNGAPGIATNGACTSKLRQAKPGDLVVEEFPITFGGYTYPHGRIAYISGRGPRPVVLVHHNYAGLKQFDVESGQRRSWCSSFVFVLLFLLLVSMFSISGRTGCLQVCFKCYLETPFGLVPGEATRNVEPLTHIRNLEVSCGSPEQMSCVCVCFAADGCDFLAVP